MKKFLYLTMILGLLLTLGSCGHNEDAEAGPLEDDEWLYPYGSSQTDQVLQQKFYSTNKIYLLFNDTLRKQQVSVNPDGTPFYDYEAVRLEYVMSGSGDGTQRVFSFDYLQTDVEKQKAVDFIQQKVLPHLGESLLPFSILLVNRINYSHSDNSTYYQFMTTHPAVYAGWRCTAVALEGISQMDDKAQENYCSNILKEIINSKISSLPANTFDEFYSFCDAYYSTYGMNDAATKMLSSYPTPYDLGLLENGYYAWSDGTDGRFTFPIYNIKARSYDLEDYTNHLFAMTEAEFTAKYGKYPIVMRKYSILRSIYESLGVKF